MHSATCIALPSSGRHMWKAHVLCLGIIAKLLMLLQQTLATTAWPVLTIQSMHGAASGNIHSAGTNLGRPPLLWLVLAAVDTPCGGICQLVYSTRSCSRQPICTASASRCCGLLLLRGGRGVDQCCWGPCCLLLGGCSVCCGSLGRDGLVVVLHEQPQRQSRSDVMLTTCTCLSWCRHLHWTAVYCGTYHIMHGTHAHEGCSYRGV